MKRSKWLIFVSFVIILSIFGIVFLDLADVFSFSDLPFLLILVLYCLFVLIQRCSSRSGFLISLYFLICMGLSNSTTGASRITERMGEWFYIFFLIALVHFTKDAWKNVEV